MKKKGETEGERECVQKKARNRPRRRNWKQMAHELNHDVEA